MNDRQDITWVPRINLHEIVMLYRSCANGTYDEARIDDVGIALYLRCGAIMEFTHALEGRVRCKRCAAQGRETIILRKADSKRELIRCPVCAWQIQWRTYLSETEKRTSGQLTAGHARPAFEAFLRDFPAQSDPAAKLLAIDRLIHEFHWFLRSESSDPIASRTACVCLLEGNATQIMNTLDQITYGDQAHPELVKNHEQWSAQQIQARDKDG